MIDQNQLHALFNKIQNTLSTFNQITSPLDPLGIIFAHMLIFKEEYYYIIQNNLDFITEFVKSISHMILFCEKDVTGVCDNGYHFAIWPKLPINAEMQICVKHGLWNGMTVSKRYGDILKLWCFMTKPTEDKQDFFIHNKELILKFVYYFDSVKADLHLPNKIENGNLFHLPGGFTPYTSSLCTTNEAALKFLEGIRLSGACIEINGRKVKITPKERLICTKLSKVFTTKDVANILNLSPITVKTHLKHILSKIGGHSKSDILSFSEKHHLYL